ncbi:YchJ family protein [Bowmanella yangjiangensis]|uniref:YchJ family protein n=1 Tax=Bowmanella yangjiangensis TaxID=2811230 RepID=UPI001E597CB6|nr:YchJ family protein [Bowmanella yangjiangensis]
MGLILPIATFPMTRLCYCHSQQPFTQCCEPLLSGNSTAPSAEALMRSRYSAYATANFDYVLNTYSREKREHLTLADLQENAEATQWLALQVESHSADGETAEVQFCAYFKEQGKLYKLHELSRFVREEQQWKYHDGDILPDTGTVKMGRNDPCFCGSERKFKQCCGKG